MCSVVFPFNIFIGNSTSSLKSIDFHHSKPPKPYCSEPWLFWKRHPLFSCRCFICGDNLARFHWIIREWLIDVWLIASYFQTIKPHDGCKPDFISHYKRERMASHLFKVQWFEMRAPFQPRKMFIQFVAFLPCSENLDNQMKFTITLKLCSCQKW